MRKALLIVSSLLFLDTIVQLYLAGFGTFGGKLLGDASFDPHTINGQIVMRSLALLAILFSTYWLFLRARRLDRTGTAVKAKTEESLPASS